MGGTTNMATTLEDIITAIATALVNAVQQGKLVGPVPPPPTPPPVVVPPPAPVPVSTGSLTLGDLQLALSPVEAQLSRIGTALEALAARPDPVSPPAPPPVPPLPPAPVTYEPIDASNTDLHAWFLNLVKDAPQAWTLVPWPPEAQGRLIELESELNRHNVMLTPPNASGDRTKIGFAGPTTRDAQFVNGRWVLDGEGREWFRVGFGEGVWVWIPAN